MDSNGNSDMLDFLRENALLLAHFWDLLESGDWRQEDLGLLRDDNWLDQYSWSVATLDSVVLKKYLLDWLSCSAWISGAESSLSSLKLLVLEDYLDPVVLYIL